MQVLSGQIIMLDLTASVRSDLNFYKLFFTARDMKQFAAVLILVKALEIWLILN